MKDTSGRLLKGGDARKRWAEYFEGLLNVEEMREAEIGMYGDVELPEMEDVNEREITREEVERALKETKAGRAPGVDGVRAEMLKEGGVAAVEWMVRLFNLCFLLSRVPVDWLHGIIVPEVEGKQLLATRKEDVVSSSYIPLKEAIAPCSHEEADT